MTVLLVEDEWLLRDTVAIELRGAGCTVIQASSGERAIALLRQAGKIDVVVTDIKLSGEMTGWDVGAVARAERLQTAIIYVSGVSFFPPIENCAFFRKPYDVEAILSACLGRGLPKQGSIF